jgi:hypothetical protein
MPGAFVCRGKRDRGEDLADPRSSDSVNQESSEEINAHQIAIIAKTRRLFLLGLFSSPKRIFGKKNLTQ